MIDNMDIVVCAKCYSRNLLDLHDCGTELQFKPDESDYAHDYYCSKCKLYYPLESVKWVDCGDCGARDESILSSEIIGNMLWHIEDSDDGCPWKSLPDYEYIAYLLKHIGYKVDGYDEIQSVLTFVKGLP
jgi:hypothetical protein